MWGEVFSLKLDEKPKNIHSPYDNIESEGAMVYYRPDGTVTIGSTHVRLGTPTHVSASPFVDEVPFTIEELASAQPQRLLELLQKTKVSQSLETVRLRPLSSVFEEFCLSE